MATVKRQTSKKPQRRSKRKPSRNQSPIRGAAAEQKYRMLYLEQKRMQRILTRNKVWVLVVLLGLTLINILNQIVYPAYMLFPEQLLLGFFLVGTTFLWLQELRDKDILQNIISVLQKGS